MHIGHPIRIMCVLYLAQRRIIGVASGAPRYAIPDAVVPMADIYTLLEKAGI
jgi:hypothetical protein